MVPRFPQYLRVYQRPSGFKYLKKKVYRTVDTGSLTYTAILVPTVDMKMRQIYTGSYKQGVRKVTKGSREQGENGGSWLRNHLWCPNDPRG